MNLALTVIGVIAAFVAGGLVGLWMGARNRGNRGAYWALNGAAVLGCAALDFVALTTGRAWLGYSALGLMGGLITGLKYGYSSIGDVWRETPDTRDAPEESEDPATT